MNCLFCNGKAFDSNYPNKRFSVIKNGHFYRACDSRKIQRYYCKKCKSTFSTATDDPAYRHHKRRENYLVGVLLASNVSMRRIAKILNISRKTVERKLKYLAKQARKAQNRFLLSLTSIKNIQFDELQTIEHTKCKPLSVAVVVEKTKRKILGFSVSKMPATGYLAEISRKKYGKRPDHRKKGLMKVFEEIQSVIAKNAIIESDEASFYERCVKKFFPKAEYIQTKGEKSTIAGQGELKKTARDPLFKINHTLAMFRANINRLIRRTWCTTKDPLRLADHIAIYVAFHNNLLTPA